MQDRKEEIPKKKHHRIVGRCLSYWISTLFRIEDGTSFDEIGWCRIGIRILGTISSLPMYGG